MTKRQLQLIREYREGVINRISFVYSWKREQLILRTRFGHYGR